MKKIITKNEKETFDFAEKFAKNLKGGELIGLEGNLGSGKTVFTKGIAFGLGIKENILSPTFVYMKIYEVSGHKIIKKLCHIDAYRLENEQILVNIGALEYFNSPEVVSIIEWADRVKNIFPVKYKKIVFKNKINLREIYIN